MPQLLPRLDYAAACLGGEQSIEAFHAECLACLDAAGAVIVEGALSSGDCDAILKEMRPYLDGIPRGTNDFVGVSTKRAGALAARSFASHKALAHPVLMRACDAVLGEQRLTGNEVQLAFDSAGVAVSQTKSDRAAPRPRYPWQLHLTQIIEIGKGETPQSIHRDRWAFLHRFEGMEPEVSTIWALCDFTEANGATRVVPGSHRWQERSLTKALRLEDTVPAEMPKGSVVIYLGSTFHSGGANTTSQPRPGLNVDYNLAFIRQEENQYLSCPPEVARTLPKELAKLIGYTQAGGGLGYVADTQHPRDVLADPSWSVLKPGSGHPKASL